MIMKQGKLEIVVDGGADAHMGKLLRVTLPDGAAAQADLEQGSPDAVRIAGELHRGRIGEELALAGDHRLDQPARQHAYRADQRSEEHTSELQSPFLISYAFFCLKRKKTRFLCWSATSYGVASAVSSGRGDS